MSGRQQRQFVNEFNDWFGKDGNYFVDGFEFHLTVVTDEKNNKAIATVSIHPPSNLPHYGAQYKIQFGNIWFDGKASYVKSSREHTPYSCNTKHHKQDFGNFQLSMDYWSHPYFVKKIIHLATARNMVESKKTKKK